MGSVAPVLGYRPASDRGVTVRVTRVPLGRPGLARFPEMAAGHAYRMATTASPSVA
jgi:hypothetical protein